MATKSHLGNPAKIAKDKTVLSFTDAVVHRAIDPLMPDFRAWMSAAGVDTEQGDWLSSLLADFFKNYAQSVPALDVTSLDVTVTANILDSAASFHPEMRLGVSLALNSYLKFLATTQSWTGTSNELAQLIEMTGPESSAAPSLKLSQYVAFGTLTPEEAGAARADMIYMRRAVALLAWIGTGRELTGTALVRRKDISEAAGCVDIQAIGSPTRNTLAAGGPKQVTSMTQLPRLMRYWQALIDTRLVAVSAKHVELTQLGRALQANPADALNDSAILAYFLFYDSVIPHDTFDPDESIRVMIALSLADAGSNKPVESEILLSSKRPTGPRAIQAILVASEIRKLAEEGLVEVGTHITVPPALRSPLASALKLLDDRISEVRAVARSQADRANRAPSESTYQIKIQIDGITPPVWRRVEVPAEIALNELHDVIQRLFAWEDYHLHEFRLGDFATGSRYAPADPEADHWGEPPLDEYGVPLNTLLTAPKDRLHYQYDFGDDWEHTITLEKVLAPVLADALPRCADGRGHAPQEDSFGPHGWMEKLTISNNPSDPDYQGIRAWLLLAEGESIDPRAFDLTKVNKNLAELRAVQ